LGKIKNPTPESISSLINALSDKDEDVRTEVAKTLGELGLDAYEAIPHLMNSLKDLSWTVRTASAQAISQIGKGSIKAIPNLLNALGDPDWRVRFRVANTLAEIGEPAIPHLMEILNSKKKILKKEAVETLGEMKISNQNDIDKISNLLFDRDESVRGKAADALRSIGKNAVTALINAYEKSNSNMKKIILSALGGMESEAKEALPIIINTLKHPQQEIEYIPSFSNKLKRAFSSSGSIRVEAARALGRIGIDSEDALYALETALNDPKSIVRREAALSIGKLGSISENAIPSLIKALKDENRDVRWRASEALGIIGVNTEEVTLNLKNLVHDKCDYVCESAILALDSLVK
jgi:HEAT repeat protein